MKSGVQLSLVLGNKMLFLTSLDKHLVGMLLKRRMGNEEWGMGNGEWGMGNGEWGMGNGE